MNALSKWVVGLPLVMACDSQTDTEYRGETLATLRGVAVLAAPMAVVPALEVQLAWLYDDENGDTFASQTASLQGEFPARFSLELTEPPPLEVTSQELGMNDEGLYALALVTALPQGLSFNDIRERMDEDESFAAGFSRDYVVIWSSYDFPERSNEAALYGPVKRGYNLMRVTIGEEWAAAHPEEAHCEDFESYELDPKCPSGDLGEECYDVEEECFDDGECYESSTPSPRCEDQWKALWAAEEACAYTAREEAGCLGYQSPERDRMRVAPEGFATEVSVIVGDTAALAETGGIPNVW